MRQAYPSCVVALQEELEYNSKQFTSLILDNLEQYVISDICEEEGFTEMVRVLRTNILSTLDGFSSFRGARCLISLET